MTGGKYVKVSCNNSVGFFQPDSYVNINPNTDYNISIKMKTTNISSDEPLYIRTEYYDSSNKVVERKDIKTISGGSDWAEYKLTTNTASNSATKMKIIFVFGRVSSSSVGAKEKFTLHSAYESIAKVEEGIIRGVSSGSTTITAIGESQKEAGSFKVNVKEINDKYFNKVLDSIFETMVPNSIIDLNDSKTVEVINELTKSGEKYWNTITKGDDKKGLWSDTTSTTNSAHITTQFNRLYDMTVAYKIKGSYLYGNKELYI